MTKKHKQRIIGGFIGCFLLGLIVVGAYRFLPKEEFVAEDSQEKIEQQNLDFSLVLTEYMEQPSASYATYIEPIKVKGIYVSGWTAGDRRYMENLIQLVNETELNAMVIDVKSDDGVITYQTEAPIAKSIGAGTNAIRDIYGLMEELRENNIFPIARIVAFKDPYLPEKRPDLALKNPDGTVFREKGTKGSAWVNPYHKEVWDYIIEIAKDAARVGFKEIQFDYIRFSTAKGIDKVDYGPLAEGKDKVQIITEFTEYAVEQLKPLGVFVSADVYGTIITSKIDADIVGQDYVEMSKHLDYICPMVYPSHYFIGAFNIRDRHPDWYPYEILYQSMMASEEKLSQIPEGENRAVVRPWLQAFTASYLKAPNYQVYGGKQIRDQIQGAYDAGLEEWILWNAGNKYSKDGLLPK
ncbi:MAG: putative glycoside hydrolase [Epulopiscium sp.]|nr:putative glycoside hydrolase [Candidatus Epulonipiscium sp.]